MNATIIRRFWRDRRVALIAFTAGALLFALMYTSLYPSLKTQMQDYNDILKSFPKVFTDALGVEDMSFASFASYFSAEYLSIIWPLLAIIIAISFAGKALSGAVESGAIGLELSQPISRGDIFASRFVAGLVLITVFTIASILGVVPIVTAFGIEIEVVNWLKVCCQSWLFITTTYSVAFAFSAVFSEKARVYGVVAAGVLLMYIVRVMSSLLDSVEWLKYLSFFHYYNGVEVLTKGEIVSGSWLVFLACSAVAFGAGYLAWQHRDIAV